MVASPETPRGVSQATVELLEALHRAYEHGSGDGELSELMQLVADRGEPRAILYLRELLLARRSAVRDAAAAAILQLIAVVQPRDATWFDELMRLGWLPSPVITPRQWTRLDPKRLGSALSRFPDSSAALILSMSHSSGFVREAAMKHPRAPLTGAALPIVCVRLRDWVPQVRAAALTCWLQLLSTAELPDLVALLPLTLRLGELAATAELDGGLLRMHERLAEGEARGFELGSRAPDPVVRRHCFERLLTLGAGPGHLADAALRDPDPLVQEWALRGPTEAMPAAARRELLERAAGSKRARVQVRALQLLWRLDPEAARPFLEEALLAPSATVREFAVWALEGSGVLDAAEFYRNMLADLRGRARVSAVAELGRRGTATDAELVTELLEDESGPRAYAAALRALGELSPGTARQYAADAIRSDARRVARAGRDLMLRDAEGVPCRDLVQVVGTAGAEHSRLYALAVLRRRCGKWLHLTVVLELLLQGGEPRMRVARDGLREWLRTFNRNTVRPTEDEAARLSRLLERSGDRLPPGTAERIRFLMA